MPTYDVDTDSFTNMSYSNYSSAIAYVHACIDSDGTETWFNEYTGEEYVKAINKGNIKYIVGVNAHKLEDSFYQDKDGFWKLSDEERAGLDNTIVHEMMHAFMDDYNTNYVRSTVDPYMAYLASGKGYEEQTVETEATTANAAKEEYL